MHPGNSGGPVTDATGAVVGVAVSAIKGTQINFAVPSSFIGELLHGRVSDVAFGDPYAQGGKTYLPVTVHLHDSLQRLRDLRLEWWTDPEMGEHPRSTEAPAPRAGASARQPIALTIDRNAARTDVPVPTLAAGQALSVQPVVGGGAPHWARSVGFKPSGLAPLERQDADLRLKLLGDPERTLLVKRSHRLSAVKGNEMVTLTESMTYKGLEVVGKDARGATIQLHPGSLQFSGRGSRRRGCNARTT